MKNLLRISLIALLQTMIMNGLYGQEPILTKKIYDAAPHCAYPDVAYFRDKLFIAFREGDAAPGTQPTDHGKIRILSTTDGEYWEPIGLIEMKGMDLRDPKISVTPKNKLLILMGGAKYEDGKISEFKTYYSLSDAMGKKFSIPEPLEFDAKTGDGFKRLWRMTWHDKTGYGVVYSMDENGETGQSKAWLIKTGKNIEIEPITELNTGGAPSKAAIVFGPRDEMMMLVRRDGDVGVMGKSKPPYTEWHWTVLSFSFTAPEFELVPINKVVIGSGMKDENGSHIAILLGKEDLKFREIIPLTSSEETGYPGMVSIGGFIWMTFHSGKKGHPAIYFTRIPYSRIN